MGIIYLGEPGGYTECEIMDAEVDLLWNLRYHLSTRRRKKFTKILFDSLTPVVMDLLAGREYTREEIINTDYFQKYIRRLHPGKGVREMSEREIMHFIKHFNQTISLLYDIKENGLINPIDFLETIDRRRYLLRGYRRLLIAKALRIKKIKIRVIPQLSIYAFLESGGYLG